MKSNYWSAGSFYITRLLTAIGFVISCFFSFEVQSQNSVRGLYIAKKEFCTSSFLFLPAGLFYYEAGCEERSYISKGGYKTSKDSVQFFADPSSELRYTVKNTSTAVGQVIKKYTLIDVDGKPLASFKVFTLSPAVNSDTSRYIQQLQTDSSGVLLLDTSQIACISFDRFNANRLSKDNHFKWEQLSAIAGNTITIQFNYPGFCLQYPDIQVAGSLPGLKRKTGEDELIDGTGNLYIKQKF